MRSFAHTWSADLKGRDIRINAVGSGVIDTPGYRLIGLDEASWPAFSAGPPTPPRSGGMEFPAMSQRRSASSPPTAVASSPEANSSWTEELPRSDLSNRTPILRATCSKGTVQFRPSAGVGVEDSHASSA